MRHLSPPGPIGRRGPNYLGYELRRVQEQISELLGEKPTHFAESVDEGDDDVKVSSGWRDGEHFLSSEALMQR